MTIEKFEDKRRFRRVSYREPVEYQILTPHRFGGSVAQDISQGGIRLGIEEFVPLNTNIGLNITLPSQKIVDLIGRVVWVQRVPHSEQYQIGVAFDESDLFVKSKEDVHQEIISYRI